MHCTRAFVQIFLLIGCTFIYFHIGNADSYKKKVLPKDGSITLECSSSGEINDGWSFKSPKHIYSDPKNSPKQIDSIGGKIAIYNISDKWILKYSITKPDIKNNTGNYTCIVNKDNQHIENTIELEFFDFDVINLDHKFWFKQNHNITIYARENTSVRFVVEGFVLLDKKSNFHWFKYPLDNLYPNKLIQDGKYFINTIRHVSNLTIANLNSNDGAKYSIFCLHEKPWEIFKLEVLDEVKLEMNDSYYFQDSPNVNKEIECHVYGYKDEEIIFEICKDQPCESFEPITKPNIRKKSLYGEGAIKYILNYPFKHSVQIKCIAQYRKNNANKTKFEVTNITIAPLPNIVSILPRNSNTFTFNKNNNQQTSIKAETNKNLYLDCAVLANQFQDKIDWLKNDTKIGDPPDDHYNVKRINKIISDEKYFIATLEIKPIQNETEETYECRAFTNNDKEYIQIISVVFKAPKPFPNWAIIIIVLLGIILPIGLYMSYTRFKKGKIQYNWKNQIGLTKVPESYPSMYDFIRDLPYDKTFEFSEKKLKLGKILGYGNFGMVVEGFAKGILKDKENTLVAVKTVKDPNNSDALRCLISEMNIMIHLGKHLNVVNLLGAITKNLHKGELKVIVEYCLFGNLESFLKNHRDIFVNQIDLVTDAINPNIIENSVTTETYSEDGYLIPNPVKTLNKYEPFPSISTVIKSDNETENDTNLTNCKNDPALNTSDLICWAYQITLGMDYISKRNIMHGDLAARNVLLAENNIVKICDFGLAKSISSQYGSYIKKTEGQLPLKWLALESLQDFEFSIKSDVWSFGVLLWELFSLGCSPYPGINARGLEFLKMLKDGYRMEKPEFANQELYDIMLRCWKEKPSDRPKFSELQDMLAKFLESDVYTEYINLNETNVKKNNEYFSNRDRNTNDYLIILAPPQTSENDYINNVEALRKVPQPNSTAV